ncbi:conserved lipothrixviral protein [Sulfolobus islandicus filamentous virus 2]|uniref:Conserved lipothrixviral protein n=1 Tax=Sulfolobus islandicus filamentous virus 2 TaxID=1902331 RepID=A0A1D8BJ91_SIFV|nr:conserved lipothrixviral protein [Sulfolobus islandicus filamentous virus 2]
MLIVQVVKKGWYIDYKVSSLGDIPAKFIPYTKTIGEEKYGTDAMCYIVFPLRRMEPSFIRGGYNLRTFGERERANQGDGGGIRGYDPGLVWYSSIIFARGRGGMVWGCSGTTDSLVPQVSGRRGGIYMVDAKQILKLDIDVDVNFYDPNWLLEKKLQQLHALGYQEEDAWWEFSPSGKHIHIIIVLKDPVSTKELLDLQFLLGDDHKRVYFNYLRYSVMGEDAVHFNVLYTYKKSLTFSDKLKAILRHWFRSKQYSKNRNDGQTT